MRYSLIGKLQYGYSHDASKTSMIEEYFDADDLQTAIVIARAMVQSHKIQNEKGANHTEKLSAVLKNEIGQIIWRTELVGEKILHHTEVVSPEHFNEEVVLQQ
ncbi:MAG: hypothetical protein HY505_02195 [Candidatus Yanofskybacteria bacterium]|nr:hypothetical protein [Candidatus Yanofskybacteria bacterium]